MRPADAATAERFGWVLEQFGVESPPLVALPIKGYRKLDPSGPNHGPHNGRRMIRENLPGRSRHEALRTALRRHAGSAACNGMSWSETTCCPSLLARVR